MRVTNRGAAEPIKNRVNFDANSMSGRWEYRYGGYGYLPRSARAALNASVARNRGEDGIFIVYSYATPIAWFDPMEGWYYVDAKYSPTTSRHQSIVRMAIDTWDGDKWLNEYVTVTP